MVSRNSLASLVLCLVLVASNMFAYAAVLGLDFGTKYIKAALVKPGIPLEIVLTKDSRRKEISAITFKPPRTGPQPGAYPERLYGSDALALASRFPSDVYPNLKSLLGLPVESAPVSEYLSRHPALQIEPDSNRRSAAFRSKAFANNEDPWTVEELIAMQLQSIQRNAETLAGPASSVRSAVLTVPPFYTVEERRAVQMAAELAGFKVLSLISDGLAVGLNYATSRTFPDAAAKPELHMVFDMGAGSTKATVMRFQSRTVKDVGRLNKTVQEVHVLGTGWDRSLGGDGLNKLIVDDMLTNFAESSAAKKAGIAVESVRTNGRAVAKLSKEAERLRHILSANQKASASFEGLYDEIDFKYSISRASFEEMAASHVDKVASVLQNALEMAGLDMSDLDSIILHGGASRTPFVQRQLEKMAGNADKIRTNVNSDEAAVFGAGFRAAELSPSFRVKEIRVAEASNYPAGIKWADGNAKNRQQRIWQASSHLGGSGKEVAFNNREDFDITFYQDSGYATADTKVLTTKNLTDSVAELQNKYDCTEDSIQLKVGMRLASDTGEVELTKIAVECEAEQAEKETFVDGVKNLFGFGKNKDGTTDQKVLKDADTDDAESPAPVEDAGAGVDVDSDADADADSSPLSSTSPSSFSTASSSPSTSEPSSSSSTEPSEFPQAKPGHKMKKLVSIMVDHKLTDAGTPPMSKSEMAALRDRLKAFASSDRQRKLREEALNELEGYTYKVRDLLEGQSFIVASTEEERTNLNEKSNKVGDWLYDEGADATREDLKKRLKELQDMVIPIQTRAQEAEERPRLIADLRDAVGQSKEFVSNIRDSIRKRAEWEVEQSASSLETPTPATEDSGEFAGLEDDETPASGGSATLIEEDVMKDRGPAAPLYTEEDLVELDDMTKETSQWLEEMVKKQEYRGQTDDPVLLVKDLKAKRAKLDKAGIDLALKSMKKYEKREEKEKKKEKASSSKKKGKKAEETKVEEGEKPEGTPLGPKDIENEERLTRLSGDGKAPTDEEIEEILRQVREKAEKDRKKSSKKKEHDEL